MIIDMFHAYPFNSQFLPHTLPKLFFIRCRMKDFSAACPTHVGTYDRRGEAKDMKKALLCDTSSVSTMIHQRKTGLY
jgi:hypothetical protein